MLGPRHSLNVLDARIEQTPVGTGRIRYAPLVDVEWPRGSGRSVRVRGLVGPFQAGSVESAQQALKRYRTGHSAKFRIANGLIYANRTDGFSIAHAAFLSAMALVLLIPGLLIMLAGSMPMGRLPRSPRRVR